MTKLEQKELFEQIDKLFKTGKAKYLNIFAKVMVDPFYKVSKELGKSFVSTFAKAQDKVIMTLKYAKSKESEIKALVEFDIVDDKTFYFKLKGNSNTTIQSKVELTSTGEFKKWFPGDGRTSFSTWAADVK